MNSSCAEERKKVDALAYIKYMYEAGDSLPENIIIDDFYRPLSSRACSECVIMTVVSYSEYRDEEISDLKDSL